MIMSKNNINDYLDRYGTVSNKRRREEIARKRQQAGPSGKSAEDLTEESRREQLNNAEFNQQQGQTVDEEPLERLPDETDEQYRRRQKIAMLKSGNFAGAAKQHAKDYLNKQPAVQAAKKKIQETKDKAKQKVKDFARQKAENLINKNPKLAKAYKGARAINDRAKAIQEKRKQISKKIQEIKNKLNIKKRVADKAKQVAARIAKQIAMAIVRAIVWAIGAVLAYVGGAGILIILIIVLVIASVYYLCSDTWVGQEVCSIFL